MKNKTVEVSVEDLEAMAKTLDRALGRIYCGYVQSAYQDVANTKAVIDDLLKGSQPQGEQTCTHELPPGCCKLCAAARKQEQTPQEHRDGELNLITKVTANGKYTWLCQVFAIGGRLLDDHTFWGSCEGAVVFVEWMVEQIKEGEEWADWRESQRPQPAVQ